MGDKEYLHQCHLAGICVFVMFVGLVTLTHSLTHTFDSFYYNVSRHIYVILYFGPGCV